MRKIEKDSKYLYPIIRGIEVGFNFYKIPKFLINYLFIKNGIRQY